MVSLHVVIGDLYACGGRSDGPSGNHLGAGPIASISLLGTPLLVLNNYAATRELLEEKSTLYSMRPLPKMVEM